MLLMIHTRREGMAGKLHARGPFLRRLYFRHLKVSQPHGIAPRPQRCQFRHELLQESVLRTERSEALFTGGSDVLREQAFALGEARKSGVVKGGNRRKICSAGF